MYSLDLCEWLSPPGTEEPIVLAYISQSMVHPDLRYLLLWIIIAIMKGKKVRSSPSQGAECTLIDAMVSQRPIITNKVSHNKRGASR